MNTLTWKESNNRMGPISYEGILGKVFVFQIVWRMLSKDSNEKEKYALSSTLPGVKTLHFKTVEEAKEYAEKVILPGWVKKVLGIEI